AANESLANDWLRVQIDPVTGYVTSLFDRRHGVETVVPGWAMAKPVAIVDRSDTWSHDVRRFDDVVGAFVAKRGKLVESGPIRAVLRVESAFANSTVRQDFVLYAELPMVEVRVTVDWREHFTVLKLMFPLNLDERTLTYEIPYGVIKRSENGEEEPYQ